MCEHVCVWEREREREYVCVCVGKRERVSMSVCVCVRKRERMCVRERESEYVLVRDRDKDRVCACVRDRERMSMCVCVREKEREDMCGGKDREREYVCMCERKRERMCVCERERLSMCVREREREIEREYVRVCVRENEYVRVCERKRERMCVCVCLGKRERVSICVCVWERKRERGCVCVWEREWVCAWERERENEYVRMCVGERERERERESSHGAWYYLSHFLLSFSHMVARFFYLLSFTTEVGPLHETHAKCAPKFSAAFKSRTRLISLFFLFFKYVTVSNSYGLSRLRISIQELLSESHPRPHLCNWLQFKFFFLLHRLIYSAWTIDPLLERE